MALNVGRANRQLSYDEADIIIKDLQEFHDISIDQDDSEVDTNDSISR